MPFGVDGGDHSTSIDVELVLTALVIVGDDGAACIR